LNPCPLVIYPQCDNKILRRITQSEGHLKGFIMNVWAIVICVIAVVIIGAIEVWIRLKH